ncbi:hypothetical protein [Pseudomonas yamanorum]|uniref:hypothetical protein n=1 Tax=Pseudomonas yamanorum TaxID=515393 RepID=UPI003B9FE0F5
MNQKTVIDLSDSELDAWDLYAAAALGAYLSKTGSNSSTAAKPAAEAADSMIKERRDRQDGRK